ncbi:hypothetical protein GYB29_15135 [bacterium]|nr:hypothetical protein [bacterium]
MIEDSLSSAGQSNQALIESIKEDIEQQYIEVKYKRLNIFLLIGNLAILFGGIFIRILRKVGFHLYLGGKLVVLTGVFSIMGWSYAGWFMAGVHLVFGLIFGIVYFRYLKIMR